RAATVDGPKVASAAHAARRTLLCVPASAGRSRGQGARPAPPRAAGWDNPPMHPKALLDACTELVAQVLRFEPPADAVVSRYFRERRQLGPRERATLAETAYAVLRRKTLFEFLARSGSGPRERRLAILGFAWAADE